jgi:hypothetical protein
MQKRTWLLCLAGMGWMVAAGASSADQTVFVKGVVINFGDFSNTGIEVGEIVKVTFTIRPGETTEDLNADPKEGEYIDDGQGFTMDFGNGVYTVDCQGTKIRVNNNVSNTVELPPNHDRITLLGVDCEDSRGEKMNENATGVQLVDSTATAIDDDLLNDANAASILENIDLFRGLIADNDELLAVFNALKVSDTTGKEPLAPPVGMITGAKSKLQIKKVVKDKEKGDIEVELLEDGSFSLDPAIPSVPVLTGNWTDQQGKGREYELELDPASKDALLEALSLVASGASGKNQIVSYKGGPMTTLTQTRSGLLELLLEAKVKATNDKGKVRKGIFVLKGDGVGLE